MAGATEYRTSTASLRSRTRRAVRCLLLVVCVLVLGANTALAQVKATYLYTLSNFGGTLPSGWARVFVDRERDETYVISSNLVRVFNSTGMEVFKFGDDLRLGGLTDVTVDGRGDIILLSYLDYHPLVTRCNFRGVPIGPLEITGLPAGVTFAPNRMIFQGDRYYFASLNEGWIIVADGNGAFRERIDLLALLGVTEENIRSDADIVGFSVDVGGNIYFTTPAMFKAYRLTPERELTSFGRPGSAPGRFGVIAGIVADSRGNVLVLDKLKCVVMVFDSHFNFVTEFGRLGQRPENLVHPDALAIDKGDHLFVTQAQKRGISVFALTSE